MAQYQGDGEIEKVKFQLYWSFLHLAAIACNLECDLENENVNMELLNLINPTRRDNL